MKFLCTKNCGVIESVDRLYPPHAQQHKTLATSEATNEGTKLNHQAEAAVGVKSKPSFSVTSTPLSKRKSLKETLQQIGQQYEEMEQKVEELEHQISALKNEKQQQIEELNEQVRCLEGELRDKVALIDQQQRRLSDSEAEIEEIKEEYDQQLRQLQRQYEELRDQKAVDEMIHLAEQLELEAALEEEQRQKETALREQQERQQQEERRLLYQQEQLHQQVAQLQQNLQEMTDQKQQFQARVETAFAYMRGDPGTSQVGFDAIELWEVPKEDVHVSNKILGTGGWGYVAEGIFRGQKVAVKCLHRGILSQFTSNHVRREISIMAQVRHPNLVLLIGAVLNADTGPLIITELLDRSLRSAYEEHLLEAHCKLPILRDIAAALTYLHSHRRPIIHRDVSSANVLLEAVRNNSWKAKLSDVGSANLIRLSTTPAEGAAPYAAPEVRTEARNQQTPKVDVYSFGVLCEISLCRFPPDPSEFAAFLASARDNADPRLHELAQNCTKRDPEQRPSMREVLTQIGELIPIE